VKGVDILIKLYLSYFGLEIWCKVILKSNDKRICRCTKGIFFNGLQAPDHFYRRSQCPLKCQEKRRVGELIFAKPERTKRMVANSSSMDYL